MYAAESPDKVTKTKDSDRNSAFQSATDFPALKYLGDEEVEKNKEKADKNVIWTAEKDKFVSCCCDLSPVLLYPSYFFCLSGSFFFFFSVWKLSVFFVVLLSVCLLFCFVFPADVIGSIFYGWKDNGEVYFLVLWPIPIFSIPVLIFLFSIPVLIFLFQIPDLVFLFSIPVLIILFFILLRY